ncbi:MULTISPECIES: Rieske (2Fe-2S) protein [Streptomyces]|uniref:Cytochrome bc1 complex Rieske iron-sulfur subunit n=1 Tax=Streptomyces lycii TaxID=2654337 RepID=A0ABQ7FJM6_9ACTN|nr:MULTISPECIES: Rieske (2Fe-2S) protein [Streptomyces]KAF4408178.1 Rieske (2Fe-2S) protein [Streptomyces lycii]PGH51739.1 Rieske (2Fe-2S) protein [Streptomyces sp. Ru87]
MTGSQGTGRVTSRRTVVAAAGAAGLTAALAACGDSGDGGEQPADDAGSAENGADSGGDTGGGDAGGEGDGGTELAKTTDIPEGGGKVFPDQKVVVTQPAPGEFKAFSSVCTHQGCAVKEVANGTINCPCHNSLFDAADGSVKGGPAKEPLPPANITVQGDSVMLA